LYVLNSLLSVCVESLITRICRCCRRAITWIGSLW